jgi:hypothetical protein
VATKPKDIQANLKRGLLESSVAKRTGGRKDRKLDKSQEQQTSIGIGVGFKN